MDLLFPCSLHHWDGVIGDNWEVMELRQTISMMLNYVMDKFWVKKAMAQGLVDYGNEQDVW